MTSYYFKNDELIFSRTIVNQTDSDIFDYSEGPLVNYYTLNPNRLAQNECCVCIPFPCNKLVELSHIIGQFERDNFPPRTPMSKQYSISVYELRSGSQAFVLACASFPAAFSETLQKTAARFKTCVLHAKELYCARILATENGLGVFIPDSEKVFIFPEIEWPAIDTTQNLSDKEQNETLKARNFDIMVDQTESGSLVQV